jgi:hypothetical protein
MELKITPNTQVTSLEAYNAMIKTIESYNKYLQSDDIKCLLSAMSLSTFADGGSADPAVWEDWENALQEILTTKINTANE